LLSFVATASSRSQQLGIEEGDVKAGIVRRERCVADERKELVGDRGPTPKGASRKTP
jgi:hypothetical protein